MASGLFKQNLNDALDASQNNTNWVGTDKVALYNATGVSAWNFNNATGYAATNEISGTGYTAAGAALGSPTLVTSGGTMTFDAADTAWTSATFSAVRGCLVYDDAVTAPQADAAIVGVDFSSDYAVTSGTFTIQWNASGILTIS